MIVRLASVLAVVTAAGCRGAQSALDPAGPQARSISSLTWGFFIVCGVVYVLTIGALAWALARHRRAGDDSPATSRRLAAIITAAVGVTVVTLIGLAVASVLTGRGLTAPPQRGPLSIDLIGHQWWWEFRYHGERADETVNAPNELHIPVGVPVMLRATSRDVIHSFWVPRLQGKRDLIPGKTTETWIQADAPGTYRGQCAEFCGNQHAKMAFLVVAEPMDAFQRWLQSQRRQAASPQTPDQSRGRDLFLDGPCVMCHTIQGTRAGSRVGPDLTHMASRRMLAAGALAMTRTNLERWVDDPHAIKPGVRMPPTPMSADDRRALSAYLETLR